MSNHPYIRAYLAGIAVPTCFMLFVFAFFCTVRFGLHLAFPLERIIIFPLALVPNAFGLWNVVYLALHNRRRLPLGVHGALLPFILMPSGLLIATLLGFAEATRDGVEWFDSTKIYYFQFGIGFCIALVAYYLVWKYLVGFLNNLLGIAA